MLSDTCTGKGVYDIPEIAAELLTAPIWTFCWN